MHAILLSCLLTLGLTLWIAGTGKRRSYGAAGKSQSRRVSSRSEALRQLGLGEEADENAIHAAYKHLMLKYHPDHGGSHQRAAILNQARDILLRS